MVLGSVDHGIRGSVGSLDLWSLWIFKIRGIRGIRGVHGCTDPWSPWMHGSGNLSVNLLFVGTFVFPGTFCELFPTTISEPVSRHH